MINGKRMRFAVIAVMILAMLLGSSFDANAASTLTVNMHHYGKCTECSKKRGDGRNDWKGIWYDNDTGATSFKWVTYTNPFTGEKESVDAYCMQPPLKAPDYGKRTASYINIKTSDAKWKKAARCLYFADGGPGYSDMIAYLKDHKKKYPDFQTAKERYAMMHMILAYAVDPDTAFNVTSANGSPSKAHNGKLSSGFQKKIKDLYSWCQDNAVVLQNSKMSISPASRQATFYAGSQEYTSGSFTLSADAKQSFKYTVPDKTTMHVTHSNKTTTYAEGKTARVRGGDSFWFTFEAENTKGIPKKTVKGLEEEMKPYVIKQSGRQDCGFFVTGDKVTASFAVSLVNPKGNIKITKKKQDLTGDQSAESGAKFRVYNASYSTYEEAVSAKTANQVYAAEITTDTEGIAIAKDLVPGTYHVVQTTGTAGFQKLSNIPDVIVLDGETVPVKVGGLATLVNQEIGIRVKVYKRDADTGELITGGSASFGIYTDKDCTKPAKSGSSNVTVTTSGGTGTSAKLSAGTYYIKETAAPAGYNLVDTPEKIILSYSNATEISDTEYVMEYTKKDPRDERHDLVIEKSVAQATTGRTFTFEIMLSGIKAADGIYASEKLTATSNEQAVSIGSISGGKATFNASVQAGGCITVHDLPTGTGYRITEQAAENYRPSYTVTPAAAVAAAGNAGNIGEPLTVSGTIRSNREAGTSYDDMTFHWRNSQEIYHSLVINKESIGAEADLADTFFFQVSFGSLNGMKPGYVVYENSAAGGQETIGGAISATGGSSASYTIPLKDGQSVKFYDITPGATYQITEQRSDYRPSYSVTEASGTIGCMADTGSYNESLSSGTNTMPDASASKQITFDFVNEAPVTQLVNRLYVSKHLLTEDGSKQFSCHADFAGLLPNTYYAILKKGTNTYTLTADANGAAVTDQRGYGTAGIPLTIRRSDGRTKILQTCADGSVSLDEIRSWLTQTDGSYTISWIGEDLIADLETVETEEDITGDPEESGGDLSAPGSGEENTFFVGQQSISGLEITSFLADENGNGSAVFSLKNRENAGIIGIPDGTAYTVTEDSNAYEPFYVVYRTRDGAIRKLDEDSGGTRTDLTTDRQIFGKGGSTCDRVKLTNKTSTQSLRITKTASDSSTKQFPFTTSFRGLIRSSYYAVIPGNARADLTADRAGNITVSITNSVYFQNHALDGIPVKIIRSDGDEMTLYTDVNGKIAGAEYTSWLQAVDDHSYTIEFLSETFQRSW